ncbi:MAG TPA: hypothetical protein VKG61_21155, partial [Streptosporangiaceae bacterium]|nr:hypothetical protein [Streptosporangiaceae bacterium]
QGTLLVIAVTAAGFNLRTAVTNLPPLFPDLQDRLHLSTTALSLLADERCNWVCRSGNSGGRLAIAVRRLNPAAVTAMTSSMVWWDRRGPAAGCTAISN